MGVFFSDLRRTILSFLSSTRCSGTYVTPQIVTKITLINFIVIFMTMKSLNVIMKVSHFIP
ncbi:hypothetical protein EDC54_101676 [Samsonia erythrinae]|uniref:Uncharacterized protein n=1 Tax=Samsonia erythrinae TaxID=160434 RepID=A0A4R3VSW8_9GAMM|nr:hypothetical protein EDC54_101676 [Samsonia erythrinae]